MPTKIKFFSSIKNVFTTVWGSARQLLLFYLIYQGAVTLFLKPIIRLFLSLFLRLKGYHLLINADIRNYFWSFSGIVMGFILLTMVSLTIYYEFSTILHILKLSQEKEKTPLLYSMEKSVFSLKTLQNKEVLGFIVYSIILLPLVNFGIQSTILPQLAVPNYILGEVAKYPGGRFLLPLFVALGLFVFLRFILILPIMIFEEKHFVAAAKKSFHTTKGNLFPIGILFALVLIIIIALLVLPLVLFMGLQGLLFLPFKILSFAFSVTISAIFPSVMICTTLVCYQHFAPSFEVEKQDIRVTQLDSSLRIFLKKAMASIRRFWTSLQDFFKGRAPLWLKKRPYLVVLFFLVPMILLVDFIIPLQVEREEILVVGHRGSMDGVENSLEAIEGAISQGADYVEIDILLSKDGVPMVIHDINLNRLAGIKRGVYEYTAKELSSFPVSNGGFTGSISTLDEVCKATKGRVGLLVELKEHGEENKNLVDETVEVIKNHNMEKNVQYQSTHLDIIHELKIKYPDTTVGYIIYGYVGNLSTTKLLALGVDFLGVEETFVSTTLVKKSHRAGLPVYVWTVNEPENVGYFQSLKVDVIITDYPQIVNQALQEDQEDDYTPPISKVFFHNYF